MSQTSPPDQNETKQLEGLNEVDLHAEHKDWLLCHSCGELQTVVALSSKHELSCFNCDSVLHSGQGHWLQLVLALSVTALLLFVLSFHFPFLTLEVGGLQQTVWIGDGFVALLERDQWLLAALFVCTIVIFPAFEIFAFLYMLIPYNLNRQLPGQRFILRWLITVQAWSMLEIFMLSVLVTAIKLSDIAIINLNVGAYTFAALVTVLLLAYIKLDRKDLWSWINTNNYFSISAAETVYDCGICKAMVGEFIVMQKGVCPRCHSDIHRRIPNSLQKTTALVVASTILYIPANTLPMMTYTSLGVTKSDTIFSGVVSLINSNMYGIAFVVFVASIFVPILKLVILFYLIASVKYGLVQGVKRRVFLHRLTEFVGRWSMVDVYVVTLLVALVQFGFLYTVQPGPALIAFGAVVVLTMIAAETFDDRLLWDAKEARDNALVEQLRARAHKLSG